MNNYAIGLALILGGLLLYATVILLGPNSTLLKDLSDVKPRPYSLSRVQLLWWTLVVAACFLISLGLKGALPQVNETCLALLGIALGTTGTARLIDDRQIAVNAAAGSTRHQDQPSEGFWTDIVSDAQGVSVHRFQAVVFNVLYGVGLLSQFLQSMAFPNFDEKTYALLGLSSAAYLAVKSRENVPVAGKANSNDQLPDRAAPAAGDGAVG